MALVYSRTALNAILLNLTPHGLKPSLWMMLVQLQITRTSPTPCGCCSGKRKQHAPVLLNSNSKLDGICTNNFQNHLIDDSGKIHNLHINKLNFQSNILVMPSSSKTEFVSSVLLAMSDLWSQRVTKLVY